MNSTRQILGRRKAVDNIRKITRTMEMISTMRYKSNYNRWLAVEDYHNALARTGYLLVTPSKALEHPLLKDNSSGRSVILAIGSMGGLCGSYNYNVFEALKVHIENAERLDKKLDIFVPQRKLTGLLAQNNITPARVYKDLDEMPTDIQIEQMTQEFMQMYMNGEMDYLGIVYMRFYSSASQIAQTLTVMPLTELIDDLATRSTAIWPWALEFEDFHFSPAADTIIENLASMIIHSSIRSCFMDALLSEHFVRMVAMKNATENADTMIDSLTLQYNRARQTQITTELLDIITGAEAI